MIFSSKKDFKEFLIGRFLSVYSPDGVQFEKENIRQPYVTKATISGSREDDKTHFIDLANYTKHPLTLLSFILGLPNRPPWGKQQSWLNLLHNFIGWQSSPNRARALFNIILMPFVILFNLIAMPFRAGLNIAKLLTELLPQVILNILIFEIELHKLPKRAGQNFAKGKTLKALGLLTKTLALTPITLLVASFTFLGYATTSPIDCIRTAYSMSSIIPEKLGLRPLMGSMLSLLSLLTSMAMYTILFPVAIHLLSASVLPYAANHLPAGMLNFFNSLSQALMLSTIGNFYIPGAIHLLSQLSLGILSHSLLVSACTMSSTAIGGLGTLIALALGTVGQIAYPVFSFLQGKWHTSGTQYSSQLLKDSQKYESSTSSESCKTEASPYTNKILQLATNTADTPAILALAPKAGPGPLNNGNPASQSSSSASRVDLSSSCRMTLE